MSLTAQIPDQLFLTANLANRANLCLGFGLIWEPRKRRNARKFMGCEFVFGNRERRELTRNSSASVSVALNPTRSALKHSCRKVPRCLSGLFTAQHSPFFLPCGCLCVSGAMKSPASNTSKTTPARPHSQICIEVLSHPESVWSNPPAAHRGRCCRASYEK